MRILWTVGATAIVVVLVGLASLESAPPREDSSSQTESILLAKALAEREYQVSHNGTGLQAPNRRHDLRTYFEPWGIRVQDRTAAADARLLNLSLVGLGRGGTLARIAPGEVTSKGARVEIARPGLVEWYANSSAGLEQGFDLTERPTGAGSLTLELAVEHARASLDGDRVLLVTTAGRRLTYDQLRVVDANGTEIDARLEVPDAEHVRLVVSDGGAAYPMRIDPLLREAADAVVEANQVGAAMGISVAGAGDVNGDGYSDVIVGADSFDAGQTNEGAAFIFMGSTSGIPSGIPATAATQLEANQAAAQFGNKVAGAGDVNGDGFDDVIVGALLYDAGQSNEGAAFVYLGSAAGIADGDPSTAATQLESNQATALLGISVAGAGDVNGDGYADVIVGSSNYDNVESNEGAAFIFLGSAAGIADGNPTTAATRLESNQVSAQLGAAVGGAGDIDGDGYSEVIVGAGLYDDGELDEGAAFLFRGGATGVADGNPTTAAARLESNQANAQFGGSVAGAGDVNGDGYADLIVGANLFDISEADEGAAFVFSGSAAGVANGNPATASARIWSNQAGARLGNRVAGLGDVNGDGYADVIVGAFLFDAGETDEGAAFVFLGSASGIATGTTAIATAQLESNQIGANLGVGAAGAGDVNGDGYADVIVGANAYDDGDADEGAAFVYLGGGLGIATGDLTTASARLESNQANAILGYVDGAGDVNGDGYADVIVGAPYYDAGQTDEGAAFLFLGSASGIAAGNPANAATQLESNQANALFGDSVAGAGDVNGDGYADVIVGAFQYDAGQADEGAAFVFLGSAQGVADGDPTTAAAQLESDQPDAVLGLSVAGAGDVNGDGYADVLVGATGFDAGQTDEGAAFVFLGSAQGIADGNPATAAAQLESNQTSAFLGIGVAGAGDVNADGYADVIVGDHAYDAGQIAEGAAFVFLGSTAGIADGNPASAAARLESNQAGGQLGFSVAGAGDVNGDGYADVIVGAPAYNGSFGAAYLFLGSASGISNANPATAATRLEWSLGSIFLGRSVAGAGDVNGDGYADVILGAPAFSDGHFGYAFLLQGSPSGIPNDALETATTFIGDVDLLGISVAGAGDVNGDGFADVIVGATSRDEGEVDEGAAFLFLGNGYGRTVLPRQLRGDASGLPVQAWGGSYANDAFKVRMWATHPLGRARAKLEVERCTAGQPFGNAACAKQRTATWTEVPATSAGVELATTINGLTPGALYRWRARVLYAPFSVTQAGITTPANPAHGPWRRLSGQVIEADVRVLPEPTTWLSLASGIGLLGWVRRRRSSAIRANARAANASRDRSSP